MGGGGAAHWKDTGFWERRWSSPGSSKSRMGSEPWLLGEAGGAGSWACEEPRFLRIAGAVGSEGQGPRGTFRRKGKLQAFLPQETSPGSSSVLVLAWEAWGGRLSHASQGTWFSCPHCLPRNKFVEFDMKPVCKRCYENFPLELKKRLKKLADLAAHKTRPSSP